MSTALKDLCLRQRRAAGCGDRLPPLGSPAATAYIADMIQRPERLAEFEREYRRRNLGTLSYHDALAIFESLWVEARQLNPDFGEDWRRDLAPDLAVARAVNGLPPTP